MDLNNTVIKVLNREHGQKVKAFFEKNGVDTNNYNFIYSKEEGDTTIYYGLVDGYFTNISLNDIIRIPNKIKIINLPMENTIQIGEETIDLSLPFPREMYVSNGPITHLSNADIRTVITVSTAGKSSKVIAVVNKNTSFNGEDDICLWQYCKEIPPVKKMTVAEIEEKLGYKVEVIS